MTCIIIEDEIPAQRILENYISKFPDLELLGSYQTAFEANRFLQRDKPNLLFLDINLPEINGLQFIRTLSNPPAIIMTTAYHEHAVESFELDTICDYLVKPFSLERFLKAINKAKLRTPLKPIEIKSNNTDEYVFVNIDKTLHKLRFSEILYVESDKNYVSIVTQSGKHTFIDSLKSWLEKLPRNQFIQVHKSYIINFECVEKINGNLLTLKNKKIPVGRVFKSNLLKKINA